MATEYLEKYIESVADLPAQLQRKFRLIRDLDEKSAKLQTEVTAKCRKQLNAAAVAAGNAKPAGSKRPRASGGAGGEDAALVADITQAQAQLLSWAEEKMHIAFQVYDLVDKHIRELDDDLRAFASEVDSEAAAMGLDATDTACGRLGIDSGLGGLMGGGGGGAAAAAAAAGGGGAAGQKKKKASGGRRKGGAAGADAGAAAAAGGAAGVPAMLDAAADSSQPRYCVCHNISYGDMVACDNAECPIEWFHFACVGLTEQPKGKWYCPECAPQFAAAAAVQQKHGHGHHAPGHAAAAAAGAAAGAAAAAPTPQPQKKKGGR